MRRALRLMTVFALALVPTAAWATEGAMPLAAVFLSGAGAAAIGFGGVLCFKLYAVLKGGELGTAWQAVAFALLLLAAALLVDLFASAGWMALPVWVPGLLKLMAAGGLIIALFRFAKVFR